MLTLLLKFAFIVFPNKGPIYNVKLVLAQKVLTQSLTKGLFWILDSALRILILCPRTPCSLTIVPLYCNGISTVFKKKKKKPIVDINQDFVPPLFQLIHNRGSHNFPPKW